MANAVAYAMPIGGGWTHFCEECFSEHRDDPDSDPEVVAACERIETTGLEYVCEICERPIWRAAAPAPAHPGPWRCSRPGAGHYHTIHGGCEECRLDDLLAYTAAGDFATPESTAEMLELETAIRSRLRAYAMTESYVLVSHEEYNNTRALLAECVEALACLTGYVEMKVRNGDGTAPDEWARTARALLARVKGR